MCSTRLGSDFSAIIRESDFHSVLLEIIKQRDIDVPKNLAERRDNGNHHFHNACYIFASNAAIECIDKDTLTFMAMVIQRVS